MSDVQGDEGFGLYIHWPFCQSKCPYCDFNSHVSDAVDQTVWRASLLRELEYFAQRTPGKTLTSIFFGGGTPSLMNPETAHVLIEAARGYWKTEDDLEITLEANPGSVDAERFAAIRDAGVNRLSLGVQALNQTDLSFLGRRHDVAQAQRAWEAAARIFPRVSFDLIYARPQQELDSWKRELAEALRATRDNGITHMSLYQLTMEPGTPMFDAHQRGVFRLPDEDSAAALYEITQELCEAAGFNAYEVSNHAQDGFICRHNQTYWRGGDYAGIGPGAHGRLTRDGQTSAVRQIKAPALWLKRVEAQGHGTQEEELLSAETRAEELVMMTLRLTEGLDQARFARLAGQPWEAMVNADAVGELEAEGYIKATPRGIAATPKGRLALNAVTGALLA